MRKLKLPLQQRKEMIPGTDSGSPNSESDDLGVRKESKNRNYLRVCIRSHGFPTSGYRTAGSQAFNPRTTHPPSQESERKKVTFPHIGL